MQPVTATERVAALDVLRGSALLGVLLINLDSGFRGSLFAHILNFHTHPGWANRATDLLLAWVFEFKAITLFSFLFGVGVGVQTERTTKRRRSVGRFLTRRFAVLLAIGLCHALLIWNGDILTLYAVCGLLLIPFTRLSGRWPGMAGLAIIALSPYLPLFGDLFPSEAAMRTEAILATRVYATGSFAEIMALRVNEAVYFISPLLIGALPRTFGLMLLGMAAWRREIPQRPAEHRKLLWGVLAVGGSLGALTTTLELWARETRHLPPTALDFFSPYSIIFLAFAYGAALLLWLSFRRKRAAGWLMRLVAAGGQMALSNYLAQSLIFTLLFYGFGFGLFGKLGSAIATTIGLVVFVLQLLASNWWLRRFRFGPAEWLWRSLTYGQWQPLRRIQ